VEGRNFPGGGASTGKRHNRGSRILHYNSLKGDFCRGRLRREGGWGYGSFRKNKGDTGLIMVFGIIRATDGGKPGYVQAKSMGPLFKGARVEGM